MPATSISVVVPVYNEAESLRELFSQIDSVVRTQDYDLELIFVDDGSRDGSWKIIRELAQQDSRVHGIRFRRNFGKAAALNAGFAVATGAYVLTLDADLQDDPQEIPRFLAELENELDLVSGWKKVRHDPWHKVLPSRVFNHLVSSLTGVRLHDHNCGMKCYRREVVQEIRLYGELHRFIPALAHARGFRVGEIVIQHRARKFGHSKYGFTRFVKGLLDLATVRFLTGYGHRPLHLLGTLGGLCFVLGLTAMLGLSAWWVLSRVSEAFGPPIHLHQRAIFFYALGAVLLGAQFMTTGLLAELITAFSRRDADAYSIAEETPPRTLSEPVHEHRLR